MLVFFVDFIEKYDLKTFFWLDPSPLHRPLAQEIFMNRVLAFTSDNNTTIDPTIFQNISSVLPSNVHLLTLQPLENKRFILRLEHFYESDEIHGCTVVITREVLQIN